MRIPGLEARWLQRIGWIAGGGTCLGDEFGPLVLGDFVDAATVVVFNDAETMEVAGGCLCFRRVRIDGNGHEVARELILSRGEVIGGG